MEVTDLKICRLCLNVICKNYYEIEGDKLLILKTVFKDLNWTVCESPVMCCECSEKLQNSYDFKSTCLITEERIKAASKGKEDKVDLWQIRRENDRGSREEKRICRFCLKLNENRMCFYLDEKDVPLMLEKCLLGLDLFMVREPVICQNCLVALECLFNFVVSCLSVEESINIYRDRKGSNSMDKVDLYNVLQFIKIKKESHAGEMGVEDFVSESKFVKSENVKDEEFEVKSEMISVKDEFLQVEEESENSVKHEDIEIETETGASKRKKPQRNKLRSSFSCPECEFTTNYKRNIRLHIMAIHIKPKERSFKCSECSYRTFCKEHLNTHVRRHTQDLRFVCEICQNKYHHQWSLDRHIVMKHPDSKQIIKSKVRKCYACDFKSVCKQIMLKHVMSVHDHKDIKILKCDKCTYATDRKYHLKNHLLTHEGVKKPFVCPKCSKDFREKTNLDSHILNQHSDKEEVTKLISSQIHYCNSCHYKTVSLTNLQKHVKSHTGDKPYVCSECWRDFKRKDSLNMHMLTRHNEDGGISVKLPKSYLCFECSKSFETKIHLDLHILNQHKDKDTTKSILSKIHHCS